ncbi:unnamed protein product [Ixodes pacificus]
MEHAVFRAVRASDAGPGCTTRWFPSALAREARRIRAIADDGSTTPCGVMFEESDSVVEKLIEGICFHPCVYDTRKLEYLTRTGKAMLGRPSGSCAMSPQVSYFVASHITSVLIAVLCFASAADAIMFCIF